MNEMNIALLKEIINELPDNMPVFVACKGHCNYNFSDDRPSGDTDTFAIVHDDKIFITDEYAVTDKNGNII